MLIQNEELATATTANPMNAYSSIGSILQRYLWIEHGEAYIWSRLDALDQISTKLMIHTPLYGNWVMFTPEFGSHNIIIQYSDPMAVPPYQHSSL